MLPQAKTHTTSTCTHLTQCSDLPYLLNVFILFSNVFIDAASVNCVLFTFFQRMKWRKSFVCSRRTTFTLMWTITQRSTSTMFPKQRSFVLSPTRHPYSPPRLPLRFLSPSSPSSPPTPPLHPLSPPPRFHLQPLRRWPPLRETFTPHRSRAPRHSWPITRPVNQPPTTDWAPTIPRSSPTRPATPNCCSRRPISCFTAILVQSSRCHSTTPYCPIQAPCSSPPPSRMAPSTGGVPLTTAASWTTRRDLEGESGPNTLTYLKHKKPVKLVLLWSNVPLWDLTVNKLYLYTIFRY